jgi:hypothetical protein
MLLMLLTDRRGDRILKRYYVNNSVEHRMVYGAGFSNYDAANMPIKASRHTLVQRLCQTAQHFVVKTLYN